MNRLKTFTAVALVGVTRVVFGGPWLGLALARRAPHSGPLTAVVVAS